jgi:hypothetical protein
MRAEKEGKVTMGGVRHYDGKRRAVVFVDEHPSDIVAVLVRQPHDILRLRERVHHMNPAHALAGQRAAV